MFTRVNVRIGVAFVVVAFGVIGAFLEPVSSPLGAQAWARLAVIAFGVFNALVTPPGTGLVRGGAVVFSMATLLLARRELLGLFLVAWCFWAVAFLVAWALGARSRAASSAGMEDEWAGPRARMRTVALIVAVAFGTLAYRLLVYGHLDQTAALFVGLPALMASAVVLLASPESAIGVSIKAVTAGLLMSMILMQEGILCILMSAPLFYAVAIVVARVVQTAENAHEERSKGHGTLYSALVLLALVPMSLEGVTRWTTFDRRETVSASATVAARPEEVARVLFEPPRLDRTLPWYLARGFPQPVAATLDSTDGRSRWTIRLRGGETFLNGTEPDAGDLILELQEFRPGLVRWRAVSDDSHMTHFLRWREVVVRWEALTPETTRVTWTFDYDRALDPAWYFGPMERFVVRRSAAYLIDAVATP